MVEKIVNILIDLVKNDWKSISGFIASVALIVILCKSFNIPYCLYIAPGLIILWLVIWFIKSGRMIFPTSKYTIIFCIKTDLKSEDYYKKIIEKLIRKLDTFNLTKKIKLVNIASSIISTKEQAERYRENHGVDLIIWGTALSETKDQKNIVNFALNFTYRVSRAIQAKFILFNLDLLLVAGTRDWIINLDNTLSEEIKVTNNFIEAGIFIIGIYLLTDNALRDAVKVLNTLKIMIQEMDEDPFKKFIQGRINSVIVETYILLGNTENEKGNYRLAKQCYLELEKYSVNKFYIYIFLARIEYLLGDLEKAKQYTTKAASLCRKHPTIYLNTAFFKILEKKYDSALYWYKKFSLLKTVDVNIAQLLEFLNDRYYENKKELAYIFAMGVINHSFYDRVKGISDLANFVSRAKDKAQYNMLMQYAKELIEAEKYRKKKLKKRSMR